MSLCKLLWGPQPQITKYAGEIHRACDILCIVLPQVDGTKIHRTIYIYMYFLILYIYYIYITFVSPLSSFSFCSQDVWLCPISSHLLFCLLSELLSFLVDPSATSCVPFLPSFPSVAVVAVKKATKKVYIYKYLYIYISATFYLSTCFFAAYWKISWFLYAWGYMRLSKFLAPKWRIPRR